MFRVGLAFVLGLMSLGMVSAASAQEATPEAATPAATPENLVLVVPLLDVNGTQVGSATLTEIHNGITFSINVYNLTPGDHGIHVHEVGLCDPTGPDPFANAGGHFNPTGAPHGVPPQPGPGGPGRGGQMMGTPMAGGAMMGTPGAGMGGHAGDLGNITVDADGTGHYVITTDRMTLDTGQQTSLQDADGSALVIHADPDDFTTQPSGNSGGRIACGVIFAPTTPIAATPAA
jgi:Cu-Zn family superoxide dismutase